MISAIFTTLQGVLAFYRWGTPTQRGSMEFAMGKGLEPRTVEFKHRQVPWGNAGSSQAGAQVVRDAPRTIVLTAGGQLILLGLLGLGGLMTMLSGIQKSEPNERLSTWARVFSHRDGALCLGGSSSFSG